MIVVKIELHSAVSGEVSEIGRMHICNEGVSAGGKIGEYGCYAMKRGTVDKVLRRGRVENYPRLSYNVWRLIARAVLACFPEERSK